MPTATLTKVGNSMAVLLPKPLREQACLTQDTPLNISSPRKGVVVVTSIITDNDDRLARLEEAERRNIDRERRARQWPQGTTAEDLIAEGKEGRYRDFLAL